MPPMPAPYRKPACYCLGCHNRTPWPRALAPPLPQACDGCAPRWRSMCPPATC